ncbi:MAG: leucine-rich repeat domain-containing protein [Candidatus Marinimicrobia bacterium]|nr:leucine-rich repeat domain-containing protein [Candidatus Neomarinimicrobiota bacterium]
MKKLYLLLPILFLIYWGCEDEQPEEVDTTPPTVSIQSPITNQPINEIVTIVVETNDNEGISKVEFFIDDSLVLTDTESPYQYDWNTTQYEDNSEHIVKVISYDNSGNSTTSQPIIYVIDNSTSTPNGGNITSVTYTLTDMTVVWEESSDGDFKDYKVLYSDTESGNKDTLETYTDKSTTSYTITEFDPLIENWFWVQVTDTLGLSSIGTGMTNELDSPPTQIDISSVTYDLTEMIITWNQSNDNDFVSYELLYSEIQGGEQSSITTITDINTTSYTITDFNPLEERWYWIRVTDYWNLTTMSNGYMVLDSPPTPSVLYPISWDNGFQITWSENTDNDFVSYKLYESLSEDMSNDTLIYETDNRTDTIFFETILNFRYYQIVVEDVWGLISTSNIQGSDYDVELWGNYYSVLNTTVLNLDGNSLTGSIPPEIGNLSNLTYLNLGDNQLTGSIPSEIGNLTNLTGLWLYGNQLTGSIPPEIGNLTNLTYLGLGGNQLSGEIPVEIGNLTNLTWLDLGNNGLTGSIPPEIGNLTNLTYLYLNNNQLTGEIPESICDLNIDWSWEDFNISQNQLCPPYPSCIENYVGEQDTSGCD